MNTIAERMYDSTIGAGSRRRSDLLEHLDGHSLWLVVAYATVYAVLLIAAGSLALSLEAMLPGVAGAAAFFTVGLVLIAAAPTVTRGLFTRALDAFDERQQRQRRKNAGPGPSARERTEPSVRPATTEPATMESTGSSNTVLVVLNYDDPATILRAVMEDPATVDAVFHLLVVVPTAEYEARRRARIDAGVTGPYTIDHLTEEARGIAQRVGREYLDPAGGEFEAMGAVGRTRDIVREAIREHDYERVYVAERRRTAWQRLLGVEDLSTELVRALPAVVTVVAAGDVLGQGVVGSDADDGIGPDADPTAPSTGR